MTSTLLLVVFSGLAASANAFTMLLPAGQTILSTRRTNSGSLLVVSMGKGLNRARDKQAALRQKMEEAKRQKQKTEGKEKPGEQEGKGQVSDEEIRERNDRLRFEELLKKGSAAVLNDYSSDGYLNKQQEEEEIDATSKSGRFRVLLLALCLLITLALTVSTVPTTRTVQEPGSTASLKETPHQQTVLKSLYPSSLKMPSVLQEKKGWFHGSERILPNKMTIWLLFQIHARSLLNSMIRSGYCYQSSRWTFVNE